MAFVQSFTATQSGLGTTITFVDTSNYAANSLDPADFVRQFTITDADDVLINTYELPTDSNTLLYAIAVNQWQNITFTIVGAFSVSLTQKYPFEQIYRNAYRKAIAIACGCQKGLKNACVVDDFYQGAVFAIEPGDGVAYDDNINSAYVLITG